MTYLSPTSTKKDKNTKDAKDAKAGTLITYSEQTYSKEEFEEFKKEVEDGYSSFRDNYKRYNKMRLYTYRSSISSDQRASLALIGKPAVEMNMIENHLSDLIGQWAAAEPSINLERAEGSQTPIELLKFLEGYLRHTFYEANKKGFNVNVLEEMASGGFSSAYIYADYINQYSFDQKLFLKKDFDPTLSYYDPMARDQHKGDGDFCGHLYPVKLEEFKRRWPKVQIDKDKLCQVFSDFNWSFKNELNSTYILIAEHFRKKKRNQKIMQLSSGHVMVPEEYEQLKKIWNVPNRQLPVIVNQRVTQIEEIWRYVMWQQGILEAQKN